MIEENPKERFEKIKNLFNSSSFITEYDGTIKDYEIISFLDIIKTLCENREKINEIISKVSE